MSRIVFDAFPTVRPDVSIQLYGRDARIISRQGRFKNFQVNEDAARLLQRCDGKLPLHEIVAEVLGKPAEDQEKKNIENFITNLSEHEVMDLHVSPSFVKECHVRGDLDTIVPQVVSLELTEQCNFNCRYCYQSFTARRKGFLHDPIGVLRELYELNVFGLELTGGEPLLHPRIEEILAFSVANFSLVGLISNGSLLCERHLDLLNPAMCLIGMQVCLDGNTPEMVEATTGVPGSLEMEIRAIRLIKSRGLTLRVGMVIDIPEKIDVIEDTLLLARDLGADSFVPNPTIDFGRGESAARRFTIKDHVRLNDKILEMKEKYKGFFASEQEHSGLDITKTHNCGAGHRNITIDWEGRIKPCPMIPVSVLSLGRVSDIRTAEYQKKARAYYDLPAPTPEDCGTCTHAAYCGYCPTRALKASEMKEDCIWRERNQELLNIIRN